MVGLLTVDMFHKAEPNNVTYELPEKVAELTVGSNVNFASTERYLHKKRQGNPALICLN